MRELSSEQLSNQEPTALGTQTGELSIYSGLKSPFTSDVVVLSDKHKQQIETFASRSADVFTAESTLVFDQFSLPSLVARVDCTVDEAGNIAAYEMEDSPSGQGITDALHTASGRTGIKKTIRSHFEETLDVLPTVIISNARNHGTDDELIFGSERYITIGHDASKLEVSGPVIVKAIPGDESSRQPYMRFQPQAVAPLVTEGDKTYAEKLGLLTCAQSIDDLLVDENGDPRSQVIKARLGSMAMGVSIYLTPEDRKRFGKSKAVSFSRLERDFAEYAQQGDGVLLQEFIPPIQIENQEGRSNAILRVFVTLGRQATGQTATVIGGCFVARNAVLLHGASDAVSGAVLVQ